MILFNPTKETITVLIFGSEYTAQPESEIEVSEQVAEYWVGKLHTFLKVRAEKTAEAPKVAEVETPKKKKND